MSLAQVCSRRAREQRDVVAVQYSERGVSVDQSLTYGELDRAARGIAEMLLSDERSRRPVLLAYPPGLDFIKAFVGCLHAGVLAIPAYYPSVPRNHSRNLRIARHSGAGLILTSARFEKACAMMAQSCDPPPGILATDAVASASPSAIVPAETAPSQIAYLQYTSGSTGNPKGVMISHANYLANSRQITAALDEDGSECGLFWLPHYHDMGLIGSIIHPLLIGRRVTLMSPLSFLQKPSRWLRAVSHHRATLSGGPSFAYMLSAEKTADDELDGVDLSSWRTSVNGSEPVATQAMEAFARRFEPYGFSRGALYPCYGLAEATLIVTGARWRRTSAAQHTGSDTPRIASSGRAVPGTQVELVAPGTTDIVEDGAVGEVWIRGPTVAAGYYRDADASKRAFDNYLADGSGPFLKTGDFARKRDGELFIAGRSSDAMTFRGRNVYPEDIAAAICEGVECLRAERSAAFSVEDGQGPRLVIAQEIYVQGDETLDLPAIRSRMAHIVIAETGVQPAEILFVRHGTLPRTTSGKLQLGECRQLYETAALKPLRSARMEDAP